MKKYFLLQRGKPISAMFVGVFEAEDIMDAKNQIRNSKEYGGHGYLTAATESQATIFKHQKVLPDNFDLSNYPTIKL